MCFWLLKTIFAEQTYYIASTFILIINLRICIQMCCINHEFSRVTSITAWGKTIYAFNFISSFPEFIARLILLRHITLLDVTRLYIYIYIIPELPLLGWKLNWQSATLTLKHTSIKYKEDKRHKIKYIEAP